MKAEFVRDLPRTIAGAEQKLWSVDGRFVVSSAADVFGQPETYLFYADGDGHITDFAELAGSFRGDVDHDCAIAGYVASLKPAQPSDPKHLPPRDCLVLYDIPHSDEPSWVHARYSDEGADKEWWWDNAEVGKTLRLDRVITWRELPEVE